MQEHKSERTVVLAYSGGLDTSFCVAWLREQGWAVVTVNVNTGGMVASEAEEMQERALLLGAKRHVSIDARDELYVNHLRFLLYANARRGGTYPLCVSAERVCQAGCVARLALETGADAIAHGSTGAGNDQVRFDVAFRAIAPSLELIAPIRTLGCTREFEAEFLAKRDFEIPGTVKRYSYNKGLWGTTVGGAETLDSWDSLPQSVYPGEVDESAAPREIVIGFTRGAPVSLDGEVLSPVALIEQLNAEGGAFGIGRGVHLGDTIIGIKGRVGFSAPAAHILIESHRELEKLVLTSKRLFWKEQLGNLYASLVHEGHYLDPVCRDLEAFLGSSQDVVSGDVRVHLDNGFCRVEGVRSPHSLMSRDVAEYGEGARLWSSQDAEGFSKIYGIQQLLASRAAAPDTVEGGWKCE